MKEEKKLWGGITNLNSAVEIARGTMSYPYRVVQNDTTLRDGLQTPGVHLTLDEKVQIGQKLDACHVYNIECMAARDEQKEVIKALAHDCEYSKVLGYSRVLGKSAVDFIVDSDAYGGIFSAPPSRFMLAVSEDELIKRAVETIEYAKERGLSFVVISATDATRADLDLLKRLAIAVEDAGADRFRMPDTVGSTIPSAIKYMIREVRSVVNLPLSVHCHNDYGLAVANSLAAVEAGAEVMSTTVIGLGGHRSNAMLEEVVVALKLLYGIDCGVKTEKLYELAKLVERLTGFRMGASKPIVGENIFIHETISRLERTVANPFVNITFVPELVGQKHTIVLGPKVDAPTIEAKLKELGLNASQEQIQRILKGVISQSIGKKGFLTNQEFREIVIKNR